MCVCVRRRRPEIGGGTTSLVSDAEDVSDLNEANRTVHSQPPASELVPYQEFVSNNISVLSENGASLIKVFSAQ